MDVRQVDAKLHINAHYFVTFIDYYSRKLWVSILKTKDQGLSIFKEFQARAEREFRQKLKAIQTDNGGEYKGKFEKYYQIQGIRLEYDRVMIARKEKEDIQIQNNKDLWIMNDYGISQRERRYINPSLQRYIDKNSINTTGIGKNTPQELDSPAPPYSSSFI